VKAAIVADTHLRVKGPPSRRGDYREQILAKLEYSLSYAEERGAIWVHLGDVFHFKNPSRTPVSLILEMYELFARFSCPKYVIFGNHDMQTQGLRSVRSQPLGLLVAVGALNHVEEIELEGIKLRFLDYEVSPGQFLEYVTHLDGDVLFCHQMIKDVKQSEEDIAYSELASGGFSLVFFGHTHASAELRKVGSTLVVRVPSMARASIPTEDRGLRPSFLYWDGDQISEVIPPHVPSEDLFLFEEYEIKKEVRSEMEDFLEAAHGLVLKPASLVGAVLELRDSLDKATYDMLMEYLGGLV